MTSEQQAYIYIQLPGTLEAVPAALLKVEQLRDGASVGRFRYGDRYLARPDAVELDPFELPLGNTVYEFTKLNGIPGAARDAGPDAWGRRVIEHKLDRAPADMTEIDYLLNGPQDGAGNLSFGLKMQPPAPVRRYNRTHQLAELVAAVEAIEEGKRVPQHILEQLDPGTSMGGARPKATIEDNNALWVGKFPEKGDRVNHQRIEYATLELARKSGLTVCTARIESIAGSDVLMLQRFDREHTDAGIRGYLRFGLVSGLTMLGADENPLDRAAWSYPLLADQLRRWSEKPDRDCAELFRRMIFNAAVTNDDDHPRNHAAIRSGRGWRLSPAYDLVPKPMVAIDKRALAMTIGQYGRTASIYNIVSQCARFGVTPGAAKREIEAIVAVVRGWREHFHACGVSARDIEIISTAFLPPCFYYEQPSQDA